MFGVCCANPGKPPPQKPPSVVGPEPVVVEEEEQVDKLILTLFRK